MSLVPSCPNGVRKCGARTRRGGVCGRPAMAGKNRCDMHGGKSPGAPLGNRNAWKHGYWSGEGLALRQRLSHAVRSARRLCQ